MPKFFDRQFEGLRQPKRIKEDKWFKIQKGLLLWMANTNEGRDLLCIRRDFPHIVDIRKNVITGILEKTRKKITYFSDFRVGAKWANVIRYRWPEFQRLAQYYYATERSFWGRIVNFPVVAVPGFAYVTDTFYPDPNPETTSVDGRTGRIVASETWATIRSGAGTFSDDSEVSSQTAYMSSSATTDQWTDLYRSFYLFDTSSIPDTNTIDSAIISFKGVETHNNLGSDSTIEVVSSTPASNTAIVNADYSQIGSTSYGSIARTSWITTGYNDITLNASGLLNISKTGISKFGTRSGADLNNAQVTWISLKDWTAEANFADAAGTTTDPKLAVTHTTPVLHRGFFGFRGL